MGFRFRLFRVRGFGFSLGLRFGVDCVSPGCMAILSSGFLMVK